MFVYEFKTQIIMKKNLLLSFVFVMAVALVSAQEVSINLPYSKSIEFSNKSWSSWPASWESQQEMYDFTPVFTIKQINLGTFEVSLYEGGSASGIFVETVHYDDRETKKVRRQTGNDNITVYKYYESRNYLWTENVSLPQIVKKKSLWTSKANSKIYFWYNDLGSATVYTYN